jgi:type I restriction enzyme S subunit
MAELRTVRIGDLGRVVTGKTPPSSKPELFGELHPFLTPTDIDGFARYIEPARFLSPKGHEFQHRLMLPERAVCVVCIGATIGKVCMTSRPSFTNQQINSVVVNEDEHDPFFVYHLMTTLRDELKSNAGGAATPIINKTAFADIEVNVPPLPIQQRIAGILSAYDGLIENSQRRIRILEEMARALYREWFVHFRFPGHETVPCVPSPLGEIPQGWEVKRLGEIAEEVRRNVSKGQLEDPTPFVGLEHIPRRSLALDAWETTSEIGSNKLGFKKGEVLFGKIRPYFHKVSIAPFDGLCSADTIVVRSRAPEHYAIVASCVSSDEFVALATSTSNGSKMPRASWSVLADYPVSIPPAELAGQFSSILEPAIDQMQSLVFQIQNLQKTRYLLLPRLLSGQIDVEALT